MQCGGGTARCIAPSSLGPMFSVAGGYQLTHNLTIKLLLCFLWHGTGASVLSYLSNKRRRRK